MPTNLSSTGTNFPTQTAPATGEPRTAGGVELSFQNSADRSEYVRQRLEYLDPTKEGVRRLRRFADIASMKASSVHEHGTVALVDGVGVYEYDSASILTEVTPVIITPTDVGVGAGRWIVVGVGHGMFDVPNGIPRLDANGKLPTASLAGVVGGKLDGPAIARGLIDQVFLHSPGGLFTVAADSAWHDVTGCSMTTSSDVLPGDTLSVTFDVAVQPQEADAVALLIQLQRPDTSTTDWEGLYWVGVEGNRTLPAHMAKQLPAPQAGAHILRLRAMGLSENSSTASVGIFNGRLDVYRP